MEEFGNLWSVLGYLGTTLGGAFGGWLFGRRKYNEEVNGAKVQNFDAALDAYKKMYDSMLEDYKRENGELKEEVASLKQELAENRKQLFTLTKFVLDNINKPSNDDRDYSELEEIINNPQNETES